MKKFTILLFLCAITFKGSHAQIINTIAGDGGVNYFGDGVAATVAAISMPSGVVLDGSGNIYIADYQNNRIRKVNTAGIISTIAGNGVSGYSGDGGTATAAELYAPSAIILDGVGNVYFAEYYGYRIRKVNTAGIISTIAGNGAYGYSGDGGAATAAELRDPTGVAVDGSGNVYFADYGNLRLRKINTLGIISTIEGNGINGWSGDGGAATAAEDMPYGVAVDGSGNVYIADYENARIRKVNSSGIISTIAGNSIQNYSGDGGPATAAELLLPSGLTLDGSGNIYFADNGNNRIRKITTAGIISTIVGNGYEEGQELGGYSGDGGAATAAELYAPNNVALDVSGNLYIADQFNNRVRKVTGLLTGSEQLTEVTGQFSIYPNPAGQTLNISFNTQTMLSKEATITIMDITGKEVCARSQYIQPDNQAIIDISNLFQGMYFISIKSSSETVITQKFIKL